MSSTRRDVTIGDVAQHAGVSRAQTARALGGYGAVSEAVLSRVLAAAEALGYRANSLAKSVSTGRSLSVGVVVGDIENPFFGLSVRGISDTLRSAGFDVVLMNTGESHDVEVEAVSALDGKRVDGFIVAPALASAYPHLEALVDSRRPLVLYDREVPGLDAPSVVVDVEAAAEQLTRSLLAAGHRDIGFVSTLNTDDPHWRENQQVAHTPVGRRIAGVLRTLCSEGVEVDLTNIRLGARGAEDIRRHVRELVTGESPVTALLASDAVITISALEELRSLGLTVPAEVSVAVFDDPPWAGLISPPLTVVSQPVLDAGVAAAQQLLELMGAGAAVASPNLSAHLISRGSIGPVRDRR